MELNIPVASGACSGSCAHPARLYANIASDDCNRSRLRTANSTSSFKVCGDCAYMKRIVVLLWGVTIRSPNKLQTLMESRLTQLGQRYALWDF